MRVDSFDFDLPESSIALRPAQPRDAARLLVVPTEGAFEHRHVRDLPQFLRAGDVLVLNDTRVIPARLSGRRLARDESGAGAAIEVTLIKRAASDAYNAFARPAKRLKPGDVLSFDAGLEATLVARLEGGEVALRFNCAGANLDEALAQAGAMPLPPYIASRRAPDASDCEDYQTVFARESGSVAAPTAGLHFTPELLAQLERSGVRRADVTLHVGPGTFLPVTGEDTSEHAMHGEWARLDAGAADRLNTTRAEGGRIIAVGTTALRTLETSADETGLFHPFEGETSLFITPGYRFKSADVLLTNFHLPRSTLFMLVCAFAGTDRMKAAYAEAIAQNYRFYSYGDASLLFRVHS
jgi:S-adenosylmethionine:tRNA ribosyltransferase-isomerase